MFWHDCRFDAPIILREIQKYGLLDQFLSAVKGFVDTLEVLRASLPGQTNYQLASLADTFKINSELAHDALGDVRMLSGVLSAANISTSSLLRHAKTVSCIFQKEKVSQIWTCPHKYVTFFSRKTFNWVGKKIKKS